MIIFIKGILLIQEFSVLLRQNPFDAQSRVVKGLKLNNETLFLEPKNVNNKNC